MSVAPAAQVGASAIKAVGSFLGAKKARSAASKAAEKANAFSLKQLQNSIKWRTEDAKRAGISPIYALSGGIPAFQPVSAPAGPDPMASAMESVGQDLSRAAHANGNRDERLTDVQRTQQALQTKRLDLENQLLASKIANLQQQSGPPSPLGASYAFDGSQGDTQKGKYIDTVPLEKTRTPPGRGHSEPGSVPDVGYARTRTGYAPVPSENVKDRIEDTFIPETMWSIRNILQPNFKSNLAPRLALRCLEWWR